MGEDLAIPTERIKDLMIVKYINQKERDKKELQRTKEELI